MASATPATHILGRST